MSTSGKRILVVNADDLGYSAQRDAGIFHCFVNGIVTSASLLVNGISSAAAAQEAVRIGLPLGLHLNLTEGRCLSGNSSSLCVENSPFMRGKNGFRDAAAQGLIKEEDVEREIKLQLAKFKELTGGVQPTHVDGHQHCHIIEPIRRCFARTIATAGVKVTRLPLEWPLYLSTVPNASFLSSVYHDACSSRTIFQEYGLAFCDTFVGLSLSFAPSIDKAWSTFMAGCPIRAEGDVICEWMVHPGLTEQSVYKDARGNSIFRPDEFALSDDRVKECQLLCDKGFRNIITESEGFSLNSFAVLQQQQQQPSSTTNKRRGHLCILTSATPFTGNQSTALRLRYIMQTSQDVSKDLDVSIVNVNALASLEDWASVAKKHGVTCAIGVHAYRAGRFLNATWPGIPYAIVLGGTDMNEQWTEQQREEMSRALHNAEAIVAFNTALASKAEEMTLGSSKKMMIAPQSVLITPSTGFNLRGYASISRKGPVFLLPLGIREVKDPLFALKCFQGKGGVGYALDATLILVGPPLDSLLYNKLAKACAKNDEVRLLGPLPREQLLDAMRQSDFILNTSVSEGQCNTILEAMTLGKLVIVRGNAGNRALVKHKVNGLIFDSPSELANLAIKAWNNREWRQEMMANAKTSMESLTSIDKERTQYVTLALKLAGKCASL